MDFENILQNGYDIYLESINYDKIDETVPDGEYELRCVDELQVFYAEDAIKVKFVRNVYIEPRNLFEIKVCFGMDIPIKQELVGTVDLAGRNLKKEFLENQEHLLIELSTRASLLISQITSSYGQQPLITPPILQCEE